MSSALIKIMVVILETIDDVGEVTDGSLYIMLQSILGADRWSFAVHTAVIKGLVSDGHLVKSNHVLSVSALTKLMLAEAREKKV